MNDVYLPPLHIKLGLIKIFVKAVDLDGQGFKYLKELFVAEKSDAKLKAGIFVGPEIRKLMVDDCFQEWLNTLELAAWKGFKLVVNNFLENYRHNEYADMVDNMLKAYENLGSRVSLKMHFMHSHLNFFPPNLGAVSDEQRERFHQDIFVMESCYQDRSDANMMGDFCWFLLRDCKHSSYKRKASAINKQ